MIVAIPKESFDGERRVALTPQRVASLRQAGLEVHLESAAGVAAGFPDSQYQQQGVAIVADRTKLLAAADVILQVRTLGANPQAGLADLAFYKPGVVLIGFAEPLTERAAVEALAQSAATLLAMELIPRISRAQNMDALSSMANLAGYKAVLLAAENLPKIFPMMVTAAGTITAAKVLVIGAGVAGLQAIATARRLGAVVSAYDVRPAVKEQVQSLGAKFVELPLETGAAQTAGGYAQEQSAQQQRRQRELMIRVVGESDVVITTAAVPGKKAPVLITSEMLQAMAPGSIVVDLAASRGGNCDLTRPDQTICAYGVRIFGPTNLPATLALHASQLYANNVANLLLHLIKDKLMVINTDDPITREILVCRAGRVVHPVVREALGIAG